MKYSKRGTLMLILCVSIHTTIGAPPQSWYRKIVSFMTESIWKPLYSSIQTLFTQSRARLVRLVALVSARKPVRQALAPGITIQAVDTQAPYQAEHVRINSIDSAPFILNQSTPLSIQSAMKVPTDGSTYATIQTREGMTIGVLFTQDSVEKESSALDYIKQYFINTVIKYSKKEGSIEQAILSSFKAIEKSFEAKKTPTILRGSGFVLKNNLLWLFGGMGEQLSCSLLKQTPRGIEPIFTTQQARFVPYFDVTYQRYNGDTTKPDRFLGGFLAQSSKKPYFIAQPHVTCLQLEPDEHYYIMCSLGINIEKVQAALAEKQVPVQGYISSIVDHQEALQALLLVDVMQSQAQTSSIGAHFSYALSLGDKHDMQDFLAIESSKENLIAAVFDGHDAGKPPGLGFLVAKNGMSIFYAAIVQQIKSQSQPVFKELFPDFTKKVLVQAGLKVDTILRRQYSKRGGTTATGIFVDTVHGLPYIFNIGDSRTMLFNASGSMIFSSHDHSIRSSRREQKRVKAMGGNVTGLKSSPSGNDYSRARIGGLIPSRVLGDNQSKLKEGAIVAYADVTPISLPILQDDWPVYVVIASDGIWDVYSDSTRMDELFDLIKKGDLQSLVDSSHLLGNRDNRALLVGVLHRDLR